MNPAWANSHARRFALDANALVGFFENRSGSAKVRGLVEQAFRSDIPLLISAVNWGEVFYVTWRRYGESKAYEAERKMRQLPIIVIGVDQERATRAAALKQKHGLGYADSFAAELAIERSAWLVTADPAFAKLGKTLSIYSLPRHEK